MTERFAIIATKRTASYDVMLQAADVTRGDLVEFDFGETTFVRIDPTDRAERYAGINWSGIIVLEVLPPTNQLISKLLAQVRRAGEKKGPSK